MLHEIINLYKTKYDIGLYNRNIAAYKHRCFDLTISSN